MWVVDAGTPASPAKARSVVLFRPSPSLVLLVLVGCTCAGTDPAPGEDSGVGDGGGVQDGGSNGLDVDGDGYTVDTDCDDSDPLVHPGADEVCGDGVDQDCDGVEEGCSGVISAGWSGVVVWGDTDTTWTGYRVSSIAGWSSTSERLTVVAAPGATGNAGEVASGALFGVRPSGFSAGAPVVEAAQWRLDGPGEKVAFGFGLDTGDFQGDKIVDLVVSGVHSSSHPTNTGEVWLIAGPITTDTTLDAIGALQFLGAVEWEGIGRGLRYSPDATGDGHPDIIPTWSGECEEVGGTGGFYVLRDRLDRSRTVDSNDPRYDVPEMCWSDGADLAVFDLDGDGIDDAALGAKFGGSDITHGPGGYQRETLGPGYVYLQLGPLTSGGSLEDADATLVGPSSNSLFGRAVAEGGDLDGDGAQDLLVGAPWAEADLSGTGIAWAVSGAAAVEQALSEPATSAIATFKGDQPKDLQLGYGLSTGGDMDGDGQLEVLAVAQAQETGSIYSARGKVFVFRGPVAGTWVSGDAWLRVDGEEGGDHLGFYDAYGGAIFGGFDVDADGFDDFVAGAELYDREQIGAAYLFYGGSWE